MLKIYGADLSTPANKVRFVANALNLDYEYVYVKIREQENKTPEFLSMNPFGKVPVIKDGNFVLFESGAIIRYLSEKTDFKFYAKDLQARAVIDQWVDFIALHITTAMNRVIFNRVFAPIINVPVDEQSLKDGLNFLARYLPAMDERLGAHAYVVDDQLTLADFTLLATLDPAEVSGLDLSSYPHIIKWRKALQSEEFYTRCYKAYGEPLKFMKA